MRIISASRRTDIPAFYPQWLMNRLREGYARVPNPFNSRQVATVGLRPEDVSCLVFWTKDPRPMLPFLGELDRRGYNYYFHVTVTGLPKFFEPAAPPPMAGVAAIRDLSRLIGPQRVLWRFDPIIVSRVTPAEKIIETFELLARDLAGTVSTATISFAREYRRVAARLKKEVPDGRADMLPVSHEEKLRISSAIAAAAAPYSITVRSCAEADDLAPSGVGPGSCIDPLLIKKVFGRDVPAMRDKSQRQSCRCAPSVDLGIYGTCHHNCLYCYASCSDALGRGRTHDQEDTALLKPR